MAKIIKISNDDMDTLANKIASAISGISAQNNNSIDMDVLGEKISNAINGNNKNSYNLLTKSGKIKYIEERIDALEKEIEAEVDDKKREEKQTEVNNLKKELNELNNGNTFDAVVKNVKDTYKHIKELSDPWAKADHAATKFTKTVGMAKKGMEALRKQSLENVGFNSFGSKYNISTEELIQAQTNYIKGIGRNISLSNEAQENMAAIRAVVGDGGINMASQFENFGVNMESAGNHIHKMFTEASKYGISFDKYAENVSKNIRIAQNYTFKDGLKGLENMARKATAIKLDMQQVANFAEKVSTVEGSIETSAKLQVLGGPFAAIADPIAMLNESLNDMEGFQDRISKIYAQMGYFDKTTGEVRVSSFNKQRLKAYAEATGQDYSSVMESVHTSAKREEILKQVATSQAAGLNKDMKELIANTATFNEKGEAGVSIRGKFKTLDNITEKDKKDLESLTQNQAQDIKQIATDLRSLIEVREGISKQRDGILGSIMSWLGRIEKSLLHISSIALSIAAIGASGKLLSAGGGILNGGKGVVNGVGRVVGSAAKFLGPLLTSPVGIGVTAAAIVGGIGLAVRNAVKNKRAKTLDKQLQSKGIERVGEYGPSKLKKINEALITGEISERVRKKLIQNGDVEILNEINRVNKEKNIDNTVISKASESIKNKKLNINSAIISVNTGNLNFADSKYTKDTTISPIMINPTEKLNNNIDSLKIKPQPIKGNETKIVEDKTPNYNNNNHYKSDIPTNITLDLNINGSLKLVGDKGQSIDMIDYLNKNPLQLRGITELIEAEARRMLRGVLISDSQVFKK